MSIKQGIRIVAHNPNAKYKMKFTVSQVATTQNGIQKTTYTYSKQIVAVKKKSLTYS